MSRRTGWRILFGKRSPLPSDSERLSRREPERRSGSISFSVHCYFRPCGSMFRVPLPHLYAGTVSLRAARVAFRASAAQIPFRAGSPASRPRPSVKNNCSEAAVCRARCFSAGAGTALFRAVRGAFQVSAAIAPFRNQRACLWRIAPIKNSRSEAAVAGCGACRRVPGHRPIVRPGYTLSASSRHLAAASRSWRLIT